MNSKNYANIQGIRGSYPLHIIYNRMGLQKGRIEQSWKLQGHCVMIKIFPCIYGQKLPGQPCMYRTVLHTEYLRTRLLKKSFLERNQKSSISEYLVLLCINIELSSRFITHSLTLSCSTQLRKTKTLGKEERGYCCRRSFYYFLFSLGC